MSLMGSGGLKQWINWLIALNYFPSSGLLNEVTQEVVFFLLLFLVLLLL